MRRFIISFISIILLYVFQCTIFQTYLSFNGIAPNLLLMFTCIVGFMRGRKSGMFTGFFGGLIVDIMSGGMIGFTSLLYIFAGYFNGMFYKEYTKEQMLLPIGLLIICDFFYGILYYFINFVMRNRLDFGFYLSRVIMPELVYTVFVSVFAYLVVYLINRQLDLHNRKKTTKHAQRELN